MPPATNRGHSVAYVSKLTGFSTPLPVRCLVAVPNLALALVSLEVGMVVLAVGLSCESTGQNVVPFGWRSLEAKIQTLLIEVSPFHGDPFM